MAADNRRSCLSTPKASISNPTASPIAIMSAEAWEDPLRTTRKHLDQLSADKGENDENIARLEDEKDLVLRALGGALARKNAQEANQDRGSERARRRLGDRGDRDGKIPRAPRGDASRHRRAATMT